MPISSELSILYRLLDAMKELNFSPERRDMSDVVINSLISVFKLDSAFFYVLDEKRENLILEISTDPSETEIFPMGYGFIGWVGKEGEILTFSDKTKDHGSFQYIAGPAKGKKNVLGVIGGRRFGNEVFSQKEKELLKIFGCQVGTAVENYIYHKKLVRSKEFRDTILYNILSGILVINPAWEIKTYNKSAAVLLKEDNLKGRLIYKILPQDKVIKAVQDIFKDKEPKKNIEIEQEGCYFNISMVPLLSDSSETDILVIIDDITELKKALEEKEKANRMSLIGQLAAGIAHEIRNPITGINISLDMLKESANLTENQVKSIDKILKELSDIEELITSLLEISKPSTLKLKQENIGVFIKDFINRVRDIALKKNIEIRHNELSPLIAYIDRKRLNQVFMNLFNNSTEAMKEGGTIEIWLKEEKEDILISFKDRGVGIKKEIIDKIYEPFYTTKREGTGLGLITKGIVEAHNGKIDVRSDGKSYTEFLITIPKMKRG